MRIIYKDFEIRIKKDTEDYEIVKWKDAGCSTTCFVIGYLCWDAHERCFDLQSVGTRFVRHYSEGLSEFITKFVDFAEGLRQLEEEHADETD